MKNDFYKRRERKKRDDVPGWIRWLERIAMLLEPEGLALEDFGMDLPLERWFEQGRTPRSVAEGLIYGAGLDLSEVRDVSKQRLASEGRVVSVPGVWH
jgi:hypothetical protein